MAKLWEDSVVTAIRDEKWLHALRHGAPANGTYPQPQLNMSGNAEQRLGDLIDAVGERFLLIEVKADRDDIEDEWKTKNAKDDHKKKAFLVLHDCVYGAAPPAHASELIHLSLRGHFLAYWHEDAAPEHEQAQERAAEMPIPPHLMRWPHLVANLKQVVVTPYLLGCLDLWPGDQQHPNRTIYRHSTRPGFVDPGSGHAIIRDHVPLSIVYEGEGRTFAIDDSPPAPTVNAEGEWGLTLIEMERYIRLLCQRFGIEPEPLHAVVMSSSGRFFRVLTTTAQLKDMVSPSPAPNATMRRRVERTLYRMNNNQKAAWRAKAEQEHKRHPRHDRGP